MLGQTITKGMASLSLFSPSFWSSITGHTIPSISVPPRSYHSTVQVDEELSNLKTWESSMSRIPDAETFCSGLACLERLYTCADNLISLPLTQKAFSNYQHENIVDELLARSMRLLDSCGSIGDVVSQVKAHVRDIRSAQRRRKYDLSINASFLKKLNKDAKKAVGELKQIDQIYASKPINLEHHLSSVIRILRDVSEVSISVFGLLLSFLSLSITSLKSTSKWSIVLKLIQKETSGSKYPPQICVETLDSHVEGIEIGLTSMFRNLIRTRASILNIKSH
ncbi:hypothetical protein L2E82_43551 [Cichorium intybus]|uniref:Uncharacterized protein n=1 Tax=Cichorium intybus TaxID=13427 RepID=A0ACB8ZNP1_CICIN|nr:hypothetical protein L2E82_43551 [Cichorium intybus]